ncbi:AIPR family protein [Verrucomicrobia bacterium]|nr:AIPR family protein [Verrucomicrobiota bacterium]
MKIEKSIKKYVKSFVELELKSKWDENSYDEYFTKWALAKVILPKHSQEDFTTEDLTVCHTDGPGGEKGCDFLWDCGNDDYIVVQSTVNHTKEEKISHLKLLVERLSKKEATLHRLIDLVETINFNKASFTAYYICANTVSKKVLSDNKGYKLPKLDKYPKNKNSHPLYIVDGQRLLNEFEAALSDKILLPPAPIKIKVHGGNQVITHAQTGGLNSYLIITDGLSIRDASDEDNNLFSYNVRQGLGTKGGINTGIRDTIDKNPDDFFNFNNGLTILCKSATHDKANAEIIIDQMQIINGAQTATTIRRYNEDNPDALKKLRIHAKIIERGDLNNLEDAAKNKVTEIVKYSNKQNEVKDWDYFSNENFQNDILRYFKSCSYLNKTGQLIQPVYKAKRGGKEFANKIQWKDFVIGVIKFDIDPNIFQGNSTDKIWGVRKGTAIDILFGTDEDGNFGLVKNISDDDIKLLGAKYWLSEYCKKRVAAYRSENGISEKNFKSIQRGQHFHYSVKLIMQQIFKDDYEKALLKFTKVGNWFNPDNEIETLTTIANKLCSEARKICFKAMTQHLKDERKHKNGKKFCTMENFTKLPEVTEILVDLVSQEYDGSTDAEKVIKKIIDHKI